MRIDLMIRGRSPGVDLPGTLELPSAPRVGEIVMIGEGEYEIKRIVYFRDTRNPDGNNKVEAELELVEPPDPTTEINLPSAIARPRAERRSLQ